jgi:hypothetical protein
MASVKLAELIRPRRRRRAEGAGVSRSASGELDRARRAPQSIKEILGRHVRARIPSDQRESYR